MDAHPKSVSRWSRRLLLGLGVAVALLACGELLVRALAPPAMINASALADDLLGFRNRERRMTFRGLEGSFDFIAHSLGCRGPELPAEGTPPSSEERVLLLGDSFIQAWAVGEEEWVGQALEAALARSGRAVEAYALCADDWGTAQELIALREYGERVRPATVVLFLHPLNDLINNAPELAGRSAMSPGDYFRPYLVSDGQGGFERRHALPWKARLRRSKLFRMLEQRWLAGRDKLELRAELTGEPVLPLARRLETSVTPEEFFELFRPPAAGDRWERAWRASEALVLAAREEAHTLGARFVVVVIPGRYQVEYSIPAADYDAELREAGRAPLAEVLDYELPERRLEEFFHREGIEHVQLLGLLRRRILETRRPAYMRNSHLDGPAHVFMGEALAARLETSADTCFTDAGEPVDVFALLGEPPIELDLAVDENCSLFGWGWSAWYVPGRNPLFSGWALDSGGHFMCRPGFVTLSGVLTDRAPSPVTVAVCNAVGPRAVVARASFDGPGPFELSFVLEGEPAREDEWLELRLQVEGVPLRQASEGTPPRLVLQRLRIEAAPPAGWKSEAPGARRDVAGFRRILGRSLRLPFQMLQYAMLGWVLVQR